MISLRSIARGEHFAREDTGGFTSNGPHWQIDGFNVLRFARDARRFDILAYVVEADIPGCLEVLRADLDEASTHALLCAFASRYADEPLERLAGTAFPLESWVSLLESPSLSQDLQEQIIQWLDDSVGDFTACMLPTTRNAARWTFDRSLLQRLCAVANATDDYESAAITAALELIAYGEAIGDEDSDPSISEARDYVRILYGPCRDKVPDGTEIKIVHETREGSFVGVLQPYGTGWIVFPQDASPCDVVGETFRFVVPLDTSCFESVRQRAPVLNSRFPLFGF